MIHLTMIARLSDALLLAASIQEDEQTGRNMQQYQSQAKQLFRKIAQSRDSPPPRHSLESDLYIFHYLIERGVVYLCLCDKGFSSRLAFAYLDDLQLEFMNQYGTKIDRVTRPYPFIEFDMYMQKSRRSYMDSRARHKLTQINTELRDIHQMTVQNIEDVLQRGEALSVLDDKATKLSSLSASYRKDAKNLNAWSSGAKIAMFVVLIVLILFIFRYLFF